STCCEICRRRSRRRSAALQGCPRGVGRPEGLRYGRPRYVDRETHEGADLFLALRVGGPVPAARSAAAVAATVAQPFRAAHAALAGVRAARSAAAVAATVAQPFRAAHAALAGLKACATDGHVTSIAKRTNAPSIPGAAPRPG